MAVSIAILTHSPATGLEIIPPGGGSTRPLRTSLDDAMMAAAALGAELWIQRSALGPLGLPEQLSSSFDDPLAPLWPCEPEQLSPARVNYWAGRASDGLAISVPAWSPAEDLRDLSPTELIRALSNFSDATGVDYRWSPGYTGTRLMDRCHAGGRAVGPSSLSPPPPARDPSLEADLRWVSPRGVSQTWILAIDQRSRYLTSCSSLELGTGDTEYLPPGSTLTYDGCPGYYRVLWNPAPEVEGLLDPFAECGEWITQPTLELALQEGRIRSLLEGYVYREHSRYLRPWYERLRDARLALEAVGDPIAVGLLKRAYTSAIGSLSGYWRRPGHRYYRPDWRHAIVAQSRANTYRAIRRLQRNLSLPEPIAVDVDCAYFAIDSSCDLLDVSASREALAAGSWKLQGLGRAELLEHPQSPSISELREVTK